MNADDAAVGISNGCGSPGLFVGVGVAISKPKNSFVDVGAASKFGFKLGSEKFFAGVTVSVIGSTMDRGKGTFHPILKR